MERSWKHGVQSESLSVQHHKTPSARDSPEEFSTNPKGNRELGTASSQERDLDPCTDPFRVSMENALKGLGQWLGDHVGGQEVMGPPTT